MTDSPVLIVGGGLAGLCCARRLHEAGVSCTVFEAADEVGGRARTDQAEGFLLDRGFQVLLTAYPEARAVLDYDALRLQPFEPGALVRYDGRFHRFADPWRRPRHLLATTLSPVATLPDKLRVARLRRRVTRGSLDELMRRPETTTIAALREDGFTETIIERFFRPFLGGVFLERELSTSSRMFDFVFRMFSQGDAALPAAGMGEMARQLAAQLPDAAVQLETPVVAASAEGVRLGDGREVEGRVVLACEAQAAARLLGDEPPRGGPGVACLYFTADEPPVREPILVLNGDGRGPINNLCVPSQVAPRYAPSGRSLVSISVVDTAAQQAGDLEQQVRDQATEWFGSAAESWRHLRTYVIPHALPCQTPPALSPVAKPLERDGVYLCGDHRDTASIQGAMVSGRRVADALR